MAPLSGLVLALAGTAVVLTVRAGRGEKSFALEPAALGEPSAATTASAPPTATEIAAAPPTATASAAIAIVAPTATATATATASGKTQKPVQKVAKKAAASAGGASISVPLVPAFELKLNDTPVSKRKP
jgi:hypothetical protein